MKSSRTIVTFFAVMAAGLAQPLPSLADSKVVTEQKGDTYTEQRHEADGTKSKLKVQGNTTTYKDNQGNSVKGRTEDGKIKQDTRTGDCKESAKIDAVTGDAKIISEGDCAKN